jgi:hypothetical protein
MWAQSFAAHESVLLTDLLPAARVSLQNLNRTFIPDAKCGCPILCGHYLLSLLDWTASAKGGFTNSQPHALPIDKNPCHARRRTAKNRHLTYPPFASAIRVVIQRFFMDAKDGAPTVS